ncbi:thiamine phosphate synthase [Bacillus shivajii]|uniref:thiamine phosphate synthase n=1 Tax=Bacillus shivajii TaxID=1983719 RepID=UPI001CF9F7D1|nr:thiamine phosphate synthase [Bacillus shivajii]UCZ52350.1 thiamine phosphate synthase [Bacillus shivajii]
MARIDSSVMRDLLKVYFISGSTNVSTDLSHVLKQAIDGGVTIFQYREKGEEALTGEEKERLGKELKDICQTRNIPFIVNDDIDLALKLDADGVHIGQDDGNVPEVRKKIGDRILGVSAHNIDEANNALRDGADYLGVGPVYATSTKQDTEKVCGPHFIAELREKGIDAPIVAIGGINQANAAKVVRGKADGLSVITAISKAEDPTVATAELASVWTR